MYLSLSIFECCASAGSSKHRHRRDPVQGEEVLTIKDVAALLKVGEKTIYSMAQSGELPAFKVRGQWRFSRKDLDAWIEQQKHSSQDSGEQK
jgi:excisionase family DNA binding protein